ncbi:protein NEGATIVE REGULATOR OF RESISTANCE-like [Nymphaea colorata]|uniref:Uncharacterized protein n=1 Tax=Nymphaea colorata TaxID=210225 RepID=A0A5K0XXP3_9MAGN|nr:protein NEGATIVE REGULATOR OF RESISTANCE-like [Nymphaea colorata]
MKAALKDLRTRGRMEGKGVAGGEKEKQGKKRPASLRDGEEVKSSKAKNIDDVEVEEFFAILRNMREASSLLRKHNPRNPSFRAEDFAHVCRTGGGCGSSSAAGGGGSGRGETETAQPSRNNHYDAEDEWERSEDNGLPGGLDLNVEPCGGSSQHQLPERRGGRSAMAEGEDE